MCGRYVLIDGRIVLYFKMGKNIAGFYNDRK